MTKTIPKKKWMKEGRVIEKVLQIAEEKEKQTAREKRDILNSMQSSRE